MFIDHEVAEQRLHESKMRIIGSHLKSKYCSRCGRECYPKYTDDGICGYCKQKLIEKGLLRKETQS